MVTRGTLRTRVRVTYLLHTCPDSLHFFQSKVVYLLSRHVTRDVEPEDLGTTGNKVNFRHDVPAGSQSPPSLFACFFVCLFVCSFVCWFCLPDPALPQEITVVASSVSSFLLSGSLHLLVCLFVCWLVGVSTKCSDEVMDAVKDRYVADASSVSPSSLWRRANDWNVTYCLLHGVYYPHQHSVDTPVCLPPHRRSYLVL